MSVAIIIPARLDSKRFPNKLLAPVDGVPMIKHVHDICQGTIGTNVYVATEDDEIAALFDYNVINASGSNGTERCMSAAKHLDFDHIINVQGDFVGITPTIIEDVIEQTVCNPDGVMTAYVAEHDMSEAFGLHDVRVIRRHPNSHRVQYASPYSDVIYFTRKHMTYGDKHLGIYGFSKELLMAYGDYIAGENENAEHLEQLRWIDMGVPFKSVYARAVSPVTDINCPRDLEIWHGKTG